MPYRARDTFFITSGRRVRQGEVVQDDDPILVGRESLFVRVDVEQATAAPGEKRALRRKK